MKRGEYVANIDNDVREEFANETQNVYLTKYDDNSNLLMTNINDKTKPFVSADKDSFAVMIKRADYITNMQAVTEDCDTHQQPVTKLEIPEVFNF